LFSAKEELEPELEIDEKDDVVADSGEDRAVLVEGDAEKEGDEVEAVEEFEKATGAARVLAFQPLLTVEVT
jgi:hypothetical protein